MELSYRKLEDVLASLHQVPDRNRLALQGRIKHFQRNGWPGGTNTGKGRRATYGIGELLKLVLGFELLQIGITPDRASALLAANWDYVATALSLAFGAHERSADQPFDVVIYCDPNALSGLSGRAEQTDDPSDDTFFYNSTLQFARQLLEERHIAPRRLALINLSRLLGEIADLLEGWDPLLTAYQDWDSVERPPRSPLDEIGRFKASPGRPKMLRERVADP